MLFTDGFWSLFWKVEGSLAYKIYLTCRAHSYVKIGMIMSPHVFILQTKQVLGYCFYTVSQLRKGVGQQPLLQGEVWGVM